MNTRRKEPLVGVSYRIPERIREWLNSESSTQERSANWLVTQILQKAYEQSQKQGAAA